MRGECKPASDATGDATHKALQGTREASRRHAFQRKNHRVRGSAARYRRARADL